MKEEQIQSQADAVLSGGETRPGTGKNGKKEKKKNPFAPEGICGTAYTLLHDVVALLCLIAVVFVFAARLVGVSGSSMYPTLVGGQEEENAMGDYLILESNLLNSEYSYGDIVVACVPQFQEGKPIVKRVIAVGGQTVSFVRDEDDVLRVCVDGKVLEEPYIREEMEERSAGVAGAELVVPDHCYFLMGDNRNNSSDSRYEGIGFVDQRYIVGRALMILYPGQDAMKGNVRQWSRFGAIGDGR